MKNFVIFAIDNNGNHYSEEYEAESKEAACETFFEDEPSSRILFVVFGHPEFIKY